jgi:hypothetical protein
MNRPLCIAESIAGNAPRAIGVKWPNEIEIEKCRHMYQKPVLTSVSLIPLFLNRTVVL